MLNRKSAPPIHEIGNLVLPHPQWYPATMAFHVCAGFSRPGNYKTGGGVSRRQTGKKIKKLVSRATTRLLREGTKNRSGAEIAEHIDFYGGSLAVPSNLDTSNILLFSLKNTLPN
ncbi:MAG: hypothetical protein IPJ82_22930 [Lewinellaceae bacterium]|nr:hypothetical protein [Lewinellaceae bacterium]